MEGTGDRDIDSWFGPIYEQFKGKPQEAEAFLRDKCEGVAKGALTYPGLTPIDLAWGDLSAGYMKIVIKHPEVVGRLQEIINGTSITKESENRIILESDTHRVVISRKKGAKNTDNWLLTAYEKKEKSVSASSSDIETEPKGKRNGTATPQNGPVKNASKVEVNKPQKDNASSDGKVTKSASNKQENGAESSENSAQKGEGREADGEKLEADKDVEGLSWGEDVVSHDNYGRETVHRTMYLDGKPIGTYYGKESGSTLRAGREEYAISVPGLETKQDLMLPLLDADGKDIRNGATGNGARYRLDAGWISFGSKEEAVEFYRRNRETIEKFNESADTEMSHEMRTMAESLVRDKELMKYANGVAFSKPGEEAGDATAMGAELGRRIRERLLEMKPDLSASELMKTGTEFLNEVFSVTNPATKGKEAHPGMVLPFYDALTGREETTLQRKLERLKARGYEPIGEGVFGPIFDQFKGDAKNAIALLKLLESGEVSGALHHKDVGDIDLVWGVEGTGKSDGYGLAKLLKYHPEVLDNIQEILDDMTVTKRSENRVQLESEKYQAAVRLTWDNKKKTWLLTLFEKKNSALDNTTDTAKTPKGNGNDTATPESTVVSAGKGRKKSGVVQVSDGEMDMLRRKWETMKSKLPEGTVFIVEHNGRYYAFGDDATRVNAALNGKGDEARTDFISLDEKQYNDALEVLDLKGFSVASYSAKDIKEAEQPTSELPAKLQPIVRHLLELKDEIDRYREIGNKSEGEEALAADKKYEELDNEASEFIKSLSTLSLEELNKVFDELGEGRYTFEWDFAKLFEKKEREKREQENLANAREAVKRSMEADLPEAKAGKQKFNIYNYTDKSASRPALRCVYHDKGYAVASDTHIIVASKEDYDAEHEGQLVTKEGDVMDTKFPNWRAVLNPDSKAMENPMPLDCDALLGFIASVEAKLKADKMKPKEIADTWQLVRLPNGDIIQVKLSTLKQFAIAAKQFGAKEIACNGKNKIYASTDKGSVVMTCNPVDDGYYDYDKVGKTTFGFDMGDKYQRGRAKEHKADKEAGEVTPEEKALVEGLSDVMREAGIEVIADAEVGQRVLDNLPAESDVKMEAYEGSVSEFFHDASRGIVNGKPTSIGVLTEEGRRFLESISGLSMKDIVDFVLNPSDCRHIINGHYGENEKDTGNNIPLNDRDLNNLSQVLSSPDKVVYGVERKSGRKMFFFLKDDGNGAYNLAEVYADRHGHLTTKTFYKTKKSSTQREHELLNNPSLSTSKTDGASSFDGAKVPKLFETQKIKYHKVYHGTGAEFEAFDFSHMGEGEGNQAYGWGGYVTEVEGIGRTYAKAMAQSSDKRTRLLWECKKREADLQDLKRWHANAKEELAERVNYLEEVKQSGSDANKIKNNEYAVKLQQGIVDDYKQRLADAEAAYDEAVRALNEYDKNNPEATSILYTVEVPEDNGSNYLHWEKPVGKGVGAKLRNALYERMLRDDEDGSYEDATSRTMLKRELERFIRDEHDGKSIYGTISTYLGSDKAASEFLRGNGFVGMSYPAQYRTGGRTDNARNFVIFNEGDMRITEKARFFRTSKGEAYGFTIGGKIYIDPRIATAETPIHEYAHLWAEALRNGNPKEWRNVVELMKDCKELWAKVKEDYPELKTDDEIAEEVLSHFSGQRGAERLRQEQRRMMDKANGVFEKAEVASLFGRIKDALGRFWRKVADMLHIHYTSAEEVADRVLYDLLRGFNPKDAAKTGNEGVRYQIVGEKGAEAMDRAEEATVRLDNLRVAREMEKSRKDAKAIRMATGWERGADGKWRYEIPDVGLDKLDAEGNLMFKEHNREYRRYVELCYKILDDEVLSPEEKKEYKELNKTFYSPNYTKFDNNYKLGAYLDATEIYKAYPELKDFPIKPTELEDCLGRVVYEIVTNNPLRIEISKELFKLGNERKLFSAILHEIQHVIQFKEGFAKGGDSNYVLVPGLSGNEAYHRLGGEVEARNVQSRMNMSEEERRNTLLSETEDVSREDQLFFAETFGDSKMGSRVDKRMAEIGDYFKERELSENERSVVDVYSGNADNRAVTVMRDGKKHKIVMRQGNENKAGTKHSIYRHVGTNSGHISTEDLLLIPEVIARGEITENGTRRVYKLKKDGITYTVYNEIHKGEEQFCNFYSNKKSGSTSPSNTQLSAQVYDVTTKDAAKVQNNFESDNAESDIVKRAKADGTYMKAPNGKPSRLNERQWEQVRTKEFKQWFGDWEKAARIKKLRNSRPVSITGKEIEITDDYQQNKRRALEFGKRLQGYYTNADTGVTVQLQRGRKNGGINELLQHNYKDVAHIQSVAAIPQIIEKSIYIASEANHDLTTNPNVREYQHFVCGLKIGGEDYTVHSLIAVDKYGNRYYDHNLTHIEKTKLLDQINSQAVYGQGFGTTPGTTPTTLNGYKGRKLFTLLQNNSSQVVDVESTGKCKISKSF